MYFECFPKPRFESFDKREAFERRGKFKPRSHHMSLIPAQRNKKRKRREAQPAPSHWLASQSPRNPLPRPEVGRLVATFTQRQNQLREKTEFRNGCPVCFFRKPMVTTQQLQNFILRQREPARNMGEDFFLQQRFDRSSPYRRILSGVLKTNMQHEMDPYVMMEQQTTDIDFVIPQNYRVYVFIDFVYLNTA